MWREQRSGAWPLGRGRSRRHSSNCPRAELPGRHPFQSRTAFDRGALVGLDVQVRDYARRVLGSLTPKHDPDPWQLAVGLLCVELEIQEGTKHIRAALRNAPPGHASALIRGLALIAGVESLSHLPSTDILEAMQAAIRSTEKVRPNTVGEVGGLADGLSALGRLLTPELATIAADACLDTEMPPGLLGAVLGALPIELDVARTSRALNHIVADAEYWREDAAQGLRASLQN